MDTSEPAMTDRFTVYDIFAVLVPGAVFLLLLATTLRSLYEMTLVEWTGGFGDATILVIAGYAAGVLLQTIGVGVFGGRLWRRWRGGFARMDLLLAESTTYSEELRVEVLEALQQRYGELPAPEDARHRQRLREVTYRAYKEVRAIDPDTGRLFAEHHQMRAYTVAFAALAIVALVSIPVSGSCPYLLNIAAALAYLALAWLFAWRMERKDHELAHHVHARFVDLVDSSSLT
jgi:hypothetical protein